MGDFQVSVYEPRTFKAKEELLEKRKQLVYEMRQIEMRENHPAWQRLRYEVGDHIDIEAKTSLRMSEAKERSREYKQELEKMNIRVQSQPTLFERQSAVSIFYLVGACVQCKRVDTMFPQNFVKILNFEFQGLYIVYLNFAKL